MRPSAPVPTPPVPDGGAQPVQQKSKVPVLEKSFVDQLSAEEQAALNSKLQEAVEADKKVLCLFCSELPHFGMFSFWNIDMSPSI